jgi:2-oxoglutarate ferredoxin oxidoreductase subunit alpha
MPWGGQKGPTHEAYESLMEKGVDIAWYYTMFLSPLNPKLIKELQDKELVIVPELNYLGQFASILRQHRINAVAITQYTGLPFKVQRLVSEITNMVEQHASESTKAGV